MPITVRYGNTGDLGRLAANIGDSQDFYRRFAAEQQLVQGIRQQQAQQDQIRLEAMKLQEAANMRRQNVAGSALPRTFGAQTSPLTNAVSPLMASKQAFVKALGLGPDVDAALAPAITDPTVDMAGISVLASRLQANQPKKAPTSMSLPNQGREKTISDEVSQIDREISRLTKALATAATDRGLDPNNIVPADLNPEIREVGGRFSEFYRQAPGPWQTAVSTDPNKEVRDAYIALQKLQARRRQLIGEREGLYGGGAEAPSIGGQRAVQMLQPATQGSPSATDRLGIF